MVCTCEKGMYRKNGAEEDLGECVRESVCEGVCAREAMRDSTHWSMKSVTKALYLSARCVKSTGCSSTVVFLA